MSKPRCCGQAYRRRLTTSWFLLVVEGRDGKPDLVVINHASSSVSNVVVLLGNGDGTFRAPNTLSGAGTNPIAVSTGDIDGDGDREQTAVAKFGGKEDVSIVGAELEAEHGCLIWTFDLRIAGKSGVQEVHIDAGNGNVLSVTHEN